MEEVTLYSVLVAGGALCVVAAIVGGGLSLNLVSIPIMSRTRQLLLAIFGSALLAIGLWQLTNAPEESPDTSQSQPEQQGGTQGDTGG
jgi:membrane protein implicated in regulation of membrane protease activity